MICFFSIIVIAIYLPLSGYFFLCMLGWLGLEKQAKFQHWVKIPHDWVDKKIPFLKFKNTKPISKNFPNIIENIFIKFPLNFLIKVPIVLLISAIFIAIYFYAIIGVGSCWEDKAVQLVPNNYGITYEIVSKEKLDKVCVSKDKCSTTVKKIMSSNDGFLFETYISDGSDSVWCGGYNDNRFLETYNPCSTIGDYGGGGENIIVTNKKNNIKKVIVGNGTQLLRIDAPEEYPYLIFSSTSEGNSKSSQPIYALYKKDDLTFVSESRENKYSVLIR